jgi:AraC-like DNA-binding protein
MCEVLEEHGIDSRDILAAAGMPRRLSDQGATTSAETSIAFRRAFAAATDRRREIWSVVAGRLALQTTHPYGLVARTARDIESLVGILEHGDLYLSLMSVIPLRDEEGKLIGVEFDMSAAPPDLRAYEEVTSVTAHIRTWDSIWGGLVPYRRMEMPVALSLEAINRRNQAGIVRTAARPRLYWYPETSRRVLPGANEFLHRQHVRDLMTMIYELRRSKNVSDRVTERLRAPGGASCTVREVATEFRTSTRSLQRGLAQEGLTFRSLQDSVKRELAATRLRTTSKPIAEVATDLGYSSPSNFSDAFRGWFGQSPSQYRAAAAHM